MAMYKIIATCRTGAVAWEKSEVPDHRVYCILETPCSLLGRPILKNFPSKAASNACARVSRSQNSVKISFAKQKR